LVEHDLAVLDPFELGDDALSIGLMLDLDDGQVWPWIGDGGVALMRRALSPDAGDWQYVGIAGVQDDDVKQFPGLGHTAGQAYQYAAVTLLGNGMISQVSDPVRVDFDGGGAMVLPALPNAPTAIRAAPVAGGKMRVAWVYDQFGEGEKPADFQVFAGADAGSIDFNTPLIDSDTGLDYVAFAAAERFSLMTAAFAEDVPKAFAVRARSSAGVRELNTAATDVVHAKAALPADAGPARRAVVRNYTGVPG
jgi:hypothetical protein